MRGMYCDNFDGSAVGGSGALGIGGAFMFGAGQACVA